MEGCPKKEILCKNPFLISTHILELLNLAMSRCLFRPLVYPGMTLILNPLYLPVPKISIYSRSDSPWREVKVGRFWGLLQENDVSVFLLRLFT